MQNASKLSGHRSCVVELLATALAISVAIVAVSRADVLPARKDLAQSAVAPPATPSPEPDDLASLIADMKLHD